MPLARVRILIAASILLTGGFAVVIQINEPSAVSVVATSIVAAVLYVFIFAALRDSEPRGALAAAEGLAGVAFAFSALLGGEFALARHWLDGATVWLLVVAVVQGLLLHAIRRARPKVDAGRDWRAVLLRAFMIVIGLLGFVALLIPTNIHPPRYESHTIGDIRTMISAQAAYGGSNGSFYDVPECLAAPQRCIPGYPMNASTFIDAQLGRTTAVKAGYRRVFHPGPPADPTAIRRAGASASSLTSYVYVAVPLVPENPGSNRGFCADATGRICYTKDGHPPSIEKGQCAVPCDTIE
jgi:hypothetical protein